MPVSFSFTHTLSAQPNGCRSFHHPCLYLTIVLHLYVSRIKNQEIRDTKDEEQDGAAATKTKSTKKYHSKGMLLSFLVESTTDETEI